MRELHSGAAPSLPLGSLTPPVQHYNAVTSHPLKMAAHLILKVRYDARLQVTTRTRQWQQVPTVDTRGLGMWLFI